MTSSHTLSPLENQSANDEIDLGPVVGALLRYQRLIAAGAGSALVLSTLSAFTRYPLWQVHF